MTITYLITMAILCLASWGIAGYIWYSHKKWELEQANSRLDIRAYRVFC